MKTLMFAAAFGVTLAGGSAARAAAPSEACDTATVQAMAPAGATVAFAAREAGSCRVNGYVTTQNPGPNKVLFVLMLPDRFNGRYLYLGVGGGGGFLPVVSPALLRKGYAVAGSDGGSGSTNIADFSFNSDPARRLDFAWRAVHVSAGATQQITRAYYKRGELHRYISGCSGGGHMGLTNAFKFGREDFDGVIAGSASLPDSAYGQNAALIAQYLQLHPDGWISPELRQKADAAILARYDELDGARDGIVSDERSIGEFDVGILKQVGFTPAQIATFNFIRAEHRFAGPGVRSGLSHPGYAVANLSSWAFLLGSSPPPWPSTADAAASDLMGKGAPFLHVMTDSMMRAKHPELYYVQVANPSELARLTLEGGEPGPDDFGTAAASGVKVILYHGVYDGTASYRETMQSYQRVAARHPGADAWLRYFPVAGLGHCSGGPGPTDVEGPLLDALAEWVEQGKAPETVVAPRQSADKGVERTFRLCAEPMRVALKVAGADPGVAENWVCRAPANGAKAGG